MAENKMKQVAELLGVELYKPFNIKDKNGVELTYNPFTFKVDGLYNVYNDDRCSQILNSLLIGTVEIEQPILTEKEKAYLEGVLRPFKDRVLNIEKSQNAFGQWIYIELKEDNFNLPYFEKDTMYKGMELNRQYSLEELGLFEDE